MQTLHSENSQICHRMRFCNLSMNQSISPISQRANKGSLPKLPRAQSLTLLLQWLGPCLRNAVSLSASVYPLPLAGFIQGGKDRGGGSSRGSRERRMPKRLAHSSLLCDHSGPESLTLHGHSKKWSAPVALAVRG